ncbi:MAG TPA: hypothetical protein VF747_07950 [Blastocatellia bacterium]|jgi:hypothetical protein
MSTNIKELMKPVGDKGIPPCDPEIYERGALVAVITGGSAKLIDRFVKEVSEFSGEPVDWHYAGGRGRVLTTGDASKVQYVIRELMLSISFH